MNYSFYWWHWYYIRKVNYSYTQMYLSTVVLIGNQCTRNGCIHWLCTLKSQFPIPLIEMLRRDRRQSKTTLWCSSVFIDLVIGWFNVRLRLLIRWTRINQCNGRMMNDSLFYFFFAASHLGLSSCFSFNS